MEVKGILLAMLEIEPEDTEEYNRWYDLDHLPEHISKRDVLTGKRYVAPRDLQGLGDGDDDATGGHPPYLTAYYLGIDDFDSEEAAALWTTKDRGIIKSGRFWRSGRVPFSAKFRLAAAFTRPPVLVSDEAVPYLAHRGVVVALGRAPSPDRRDDALRWWDRTHLVDLLAVDGVLAALRFDAVDAPARDLLLHLLLLEDDPTTVMPRIRGALRYGEATGRYPAYGGVYESVAFLPYRSIVPLEYDFEW
ncbi:MAG TPA: hypothetical protein VEP49_06635 [Acidimicrobiia bacterium]|nr:hypothetical protein [Acidimicrobiia bacterium]